MARLETNRFREMEMFLKVVDLEGFSPAARFYRLTPSAVSKLISRLEKRLKARLFNRSTRQLQLTAEGEIFYVQAQRAINQLEEAEQAISSNQTATGHLRISSSIPVGRHYILPILADFQRQYPDVTLDITLTDHVVDLLAEGTDVAIRSGQLKSSNLHARKLAETKKIIVASPSYIQSYGKPQKPQDLLQHCCLGFNFARAEQDWPFIINKHHKKIKITSKIQVSDGESLRQLALQGAGLTRIAAFQVQQDIKTKRLIPLLSRYSCNDTESIYAVYIGQGGHLPIRTRVFIDFLVEKINFPT